MESKNTRQDAVHLCLELPSTIEVDGRLRPTKNSEGRFIASTSEGVRNFWRWFGNSKMIDDLGRPLVTYHGTASPSFTRDGERSAFAERCGAGEGAYFTPNPQIAANYAVSDAEVGDGDPAIIPAYLAIRSPWVCQDGYTSQSITPEKKAELLAQGMDGVLGYSSTGELIEIVVLSPNQIKSAVGNSGLFLPGEACIVDKPAPTKKSRMRP